MNGEIYYIRYTFCANCGHGWHSHVEIPKGVSVRVFLSQKRCYNCDCKGFIQQYIPNVTGRY